MKNFGSSIDKKLYNCPACNKRRLKLPIGVEQDTSTKEFEVPSGEKVELHIQVCDNCARKYFNKYWTPKKSDLTKVFKALHEDAELPEDTSLEELL